MAEALKDIDDVKMLTYGVISRLANTSYGSVALHAGLEPLCDGLIATIAKPKPKPDPKAKQAADKEVCKTRILNSLQTKFISDLSPQVVQVNEELIKNGLRTIAALAEIPGAIGNPKFDQVMANITDSDLKDKFTAAKSEGELRKSRDALRSSQK